MASTALTLCLPACLALVTGGRERGKCGWSVGQWVGGILGSWWNPIMAARSWAMCPNSLWFSLWFPERKDLFPNIRTSIFMAG